jgi:putative ABC transport system permease protein
VRLAALARIGLGDLGGGFRGLRIFLACVAIGVAAIVGVNSLAQALQDGLAREGRRIVGGDASFSVIHQELSPQERAWLSARGRLDDIATMRAMARNGAGDATLADVKAVGPDWPPVGRAEFAPEAAPAAAFARAGDAFGAEVDDILLDRLGLKLGDAFRLGDARLVVRGRIVSEPDRLGAGIGFGARVLISRQALAASGLVQPGSLIRYTTRLTMSPGGPPPSLAEVRAMIEAAKAAFPEAGWEVRDRARVDPNFSRNVDRFGEFLALVGLISLVVGGVGVGNAASGFLEARRPTLAILKALGATGAEIVLVALFEFLIVAALGVVIGLALGASIPYLAAGFASAALPYPIEPGLYVGEWALGALYGALTALAFSIAPLGRAHDLPATALFRDLVAADAPRTRLRYALAAVAAGAALALAAIVASPQRTVAVTVVVATALALVALRGVALAAMALARRLPRRGPLEWRLALSNLHRPGAPTPAVVLSLGLGLAVIVALTLVDADLRAELKPEAAGTPDFYFFDIRSNQEDSFKSFLKTNAPGARLAEAPMMRGRVVSLAGVAAEKVHAKESAQWVLDGDRGVTYAAAPPKGAKITEGEWWPADYSGPPLVSVDGEIARGLGLKLGDTLAVNVLGRDVTARIANFRRVDWRSFAINFVFVFSPNTFAGAPHSVLMTAELAEGAPPGAEVKLVRDAARAFPDVVTVRVKEALQTVAALVARLDLAIRAAAGVALATAVLVLAGALAANAQSRLMDAVRLKILGATRRRLIAASALEFAALGAATAGFGVGAGTLAAYVIVARVMQLDFGFAWGPTLLAALGGLALTVALGLVGVWRTLGRKPAEVLRAG